VGFQNLIDAILQGEPVSPQVANRPLNEIQSNCLYLLSLFNASKIGQAIIAYNQPVETPAVLGAPLWFNPATARFERGLAALDATLGGSLKASGSSQIWGILQNRYTGLAAGDILLFGYETLDVSAAIVGGSPPVPAGNYYLSALTAGMLTTVRPAVPVSVLRADGAGNVLCNPQWTDYVDRHIPYTIYLTCYPAGNTVPPLLGMTHTITNPNPALPGWLPANHAIFGGLAPKKAQFGYNLGAQPSLNALWPPFPLALARLEWNKGLSPDQGFQGVPMTPPSALAEIDANGIWWMSNCYGDVPWPLHLNTFDPDATSYSWSEGTCPYHAQMQLRIMFNK
jgi:hypothetical protein